MKKRFLKRVEDKFLQKRFPENLVPKKALRKSGKQVRGKDQIFEHLGRFASLSLQLKRAVRSIHRRKVALEYSPLLRIDALERGSISSSLSGHQFLSLSKIWDQSQSRLSYLPQKRSSLPKLLINRRLKKKTLLYSSSQLEGAFSKQQEKRSSPLLLQLIEKKKLRILYGNLSNREINALIGRAAKGRGRFSDILFRLLESRLDVVLCKTGFFPTIPFARQWVYHGKILINKRVMTLANYLLKPGDVISIPQADWHTLKRYINERAGAFPMRSWKDLESQFWSGNGVTAFPSPNKNQWQIFPWSTRHTVFADAAPCWSIINLDPQGIRCPPLTPSQVPLKKSEEEKKVIYSTPSSRDKVETGSKSMTSFSSDWKDVVNDKKRGTLEHITLREMLVDSKDGGAPRIDKKESHSEVRKLHQELARNKLRFFSLKMTHVEISFGLLIAIYLYPAQRVILPATIDVEKILNR